MRYERKISTKQYEYLYDYFEKNYSKIEHAELVDAVPIYIIKRDSENFNKVMAPYRAKFYLVGSKGATAIRIIVDETRLIITSIFGSIMFSFAFYLSHGDTTSIAIGAILGAVYHWLFRKSMKNATEKFYKHLISLSK